MTLEQAARIADTRDLHRVMAQARSEIERGLGTAEIYERAAAVRAELSQREQAATESEVPR